jgi:Transposase, Mutator family
VTRYSRTLVVRIFPNAESCLRLVRALAVEIHEDWIEATRYLNMELLEDQARATACQGKVEMSPSWQSRNVPFLPGV